MSLFTNQRGMPQVSRSDQINRLLAGLRAGGAKPAVTEMMRDRPFPFDVKLSDGTRFSAPLYCWNITHGGGRRNPEERRVQMTGVPRPVLYIAGNAVPFLLGYDVVEDVFAAWDATNHRQTRDPGAAGGSNSLYVAHGILAQASKLGFASEERPLEGGATQVVVAFRPEVADAYFRIAVALRATGAVNVTATVLAASGRPFARAALSQRRKAALRQILQTVRSTRFPGEVLNAYGSRCAFCGLGADLVEAAHIKSVKAQGPDHVTNGLALCPTHHRAFDRFLVVVADDFSLSVNPKRMTRLDAADIRKLRASLRQRVALPSDPTARPDLRFVRFHRKLAAA